MSGNISRILVGADIIRPQKNRFQSHRNSKHFLLPDNLFCCSFTAPSTRSSPASHTRSKTQPTSPRSGARCPCRTRRDTVRSSHGRAAYKALSRILRKADSIDTVHYALCDILEHGIMHDIRPNIRGKQPEILHAASSGGFQSPSLRFL